MNTGHAILIECYGGALDGARVRVALQAADSPVYLVRRRLERGGFEVFAYEWANRTSGGGRFWVVRFLRRVGEMGGKC
jgi:hypothetical protein